MLRHFVPIILAAALGSGSTCSSDTAATQPDTARSVGSPATAGDELKCVDAWLEKKGLDQYGSPAGTMYMGGTPLFDESSGKTTDRLEHVYQKQPEAKAACHR